MSSSIRTVGGQIGPKAPVSGSNGVVASQHPIVTEAIAKVLQRGGNAIDGAIAGAITQATVQQDMTNHAGSILVLYWHNADQRVYELNSTGVIPPGVKPIRPVPPGRGMLTAWPREPMAVIPGFMPAMKALYERFATLPWQELCADALRWAEEGHTVTPFEARANSRNVEFFSYTDSGRRHFFPDGRLKVVGETWRKPELARTLHRLSRDGPDLFIEGDWARSFVELGNRLGWDVSLADMSRFPPRWGEGLAYAHGDKTIVQFSPPERQAVFSSIVLGVARHLELGSSLYWKDARTAYLLAMAMYRATLDVGYVHDPEVFESPVEVLLDEAYHDHLARLLRKSIPKQDLSAHVRLTSAATGSGLPDPGSCETTIVDGAGNWVQMMNTFQSGGIPGHVIDGVPMVGSHAVTTLAADMAGWFAGGGRLRTVLGSTFVLDADGRPELSLGSPANGARIVPLVLHSILDCGMDPAAAESAPLMMPMESNYVIRMESRVSGEFVRDLGSMGVAFDPLEPYDPYMGSFQSAWRTPDGMLNAVAGYRREGAAAAL